MTETSWARLSEYSTGFEADVARAALAVAEIPVLVQGEQPGIFGAGFQGMQPGGITLYVPASALDRARVALGIEEEDHA